MSRADLMTMESRRLRWSLSPPLWVLEAYSLLIDTARIRLASALTSIAVVALMMFLCVITHSWHFYKMLCPGLDLVSSF